MASYETKLMRMALPLLRPLSVTVIAMMMMMMQMKMKQKKMTMTMLTLMMLAGFGGTVTVWAVVRR